MQATDRTLNHPHQERGPYGGYDVERIVRRERTLLVATLVLVLLACWSWILPMARDMYGAMTGPSAWMMTGAWDAPHLLLLGAMWMVMMAGMMLPSATPALLLFAAVARRRSGDRGAWWRVYAMAAGYLFVWAGFSVSATLLQWMLSALLVLSPMMEVRSPLLSVISSHRSSRRVSRHVVHRSCS
jgi:predicted metal-binding membrane protein